MFLNFNYHMVKLTFLVYRSMSFYIHIDPCKHCVSWNTEQSHHPRKLPRLFLCDHTLPPSQLP